jgi:hypothetical protein
MRIVVMLVLIRLLVVVLVVLLLLLLRCAYLFWLCSIPIFDCSIAVLMSRVVPLSRVVVGRVHEIFMSLCRMTSIPQMEMSWGWRRCVVGISLLKR